MFVLSILKNSVKIEPHFLGRDFTEVLVERINQQFANFVGFLIINQQKRVNITIFYLGYTRRGFVHYFLRLQKNRSFFYFGISTL